MSQIIPAILTDDPKIFEQQLRQVEGLTDIVHLDICDGFFTPRKTIMADDIKNIKTNIQYAIHLMVQNPSPEIEKWYNFPNIRRIIFHFETAKIPAAVIEHIEAYGFKAGMAINPETTLEDLGGASYQTDLMLFMAVHPGQQGQTFIPETLDKIKAFKQKFPRLPVAVDGGIHQAELPKLMELGVDYIVMGSEIFEHPDPAAHLKKLQNQLLISEKD